MRHQTDENDHQTGSKSDVSVHITVTEVIERCSSKIAVKIIMDDDPKIQKMCLME
jgi:hypothetical protein